ncbi:MAG: acyltransferase family protein [Rubrivivax sp.]|nr:acyltransferase family protein [Rubrivivax sp.]
MNAPAATLRPDVQGLRGVAVLLVVLYHAGLPFLPGGYVGVDVFFVISGYLITGLLVREVQAKGRIDLPNFIARRARRLLPAAITLIVVVVWASVLIYPPLERTDIVAAARAASLYAANLWFTSRAVDYLGGDAAVNPMLHMWSLGVEEQFYLLWPLMVSLAATRLRGGTAVRRIWWMTIAVSAVTFVACVWMTRNSQPWAFFLTPFRAWEFGLGAMAHLAHPRLQAVPAAWLRAAGWAGAAAIAASGLALGHGTLFPGPWALLPAGGTALVLASLHETGSTALRTGLSFRPLARVGDVSYSWYLWHWPLLVMAPVVYPQAGPKATLVALVLSYLAAEASYRWIEKPFRVGHAARARPRLAVIAALSTTVVAGGALTLLHSSTLDAPVSARQQLYIDARKDIPVVYAKGCHVPIKVDKVTACDAGEPTADRVVVLLGDSHAAHWYPALDALGAQQGWRLVSMTKSACPWVDTPVDVELAGFRRPYPECATWRAEAVRRIAALKPDVVVLASGSRYAGVAASAWEAGARRTIAALGSAGTRIVILHDTPWPGFNVPTCLARAEHRGANPEITCAFARQKALEPGRLIFEAERRASEGATDVLLVDLSVHLCPGQQCGVLTGATVHFSDHSHLTAGFSRGLAPAVAAALQRAFTNREPSDALVPTQGDHAASR